MVYALTLEGAHDQQTAEGRGWRSKRPGQYLSTEPGEIEAFICRQRLEAIESEQALVFCSQEPSETSVGPLLLNQTFILSA